MSRKIQRTGRNRSGPDYRQTSPVTAYLLGRAARVLLRFLDDLRLHQCCDLARQHDVSQYRHHHPAVIGPGRRDTLIQRSNARVQLLRQLGSIDGFADEASSPRASNSRTASETVRPLRRA
ncbi:MAG: hypothetical protein AB1651_17065 [Pseudomonadota bacterium]